MDNIKNEGMIVLNNIAIGYKDILATIKEELQFEVGKVYLVFGKNGSGKSTLFKSVLGIIPLIQGEINFEDNTNIKSKQISFVPTKIDFPSHMCLEEFVSLGRHPYTNHFGVLNEKDKEIVKSYIALLGLNELSQKFVSDFSDGEKQLSMIAKALVQETPIILLDEPSAFLDYQNKLNLMKKLKELAINQQKCILISSHDIDLGLAFGDAFLCFEEQVIKLYHQLSKEVLIENVFK